MGYQKQQIDKVCPVCRVDFKGNSKQKYCSDSCRNKRQKEQLAALTERRRKCPSCGFDLTISGKRRQRVKR
jgi:hypothetical protein